MRRALRWFWKTGMLSTFLAGLFAVLPIVITVGIMAWFGGLLTEWLGAESFVGDSLRQLGLRLVTDPIVASVLGWVGTLMHVNSDGYAVAIAHKGEADVLPGLLANAIRAGASDVHILPHHILISRFLVLRALER